MRVVQLVGIVAMLCGCSTYQRPGPGDPPKPRPEASARKAPGVPKVERWTRTQRECETGDRKDQRRCIMPYPEE